jgi:toxin FitB
VNFLLDTNVVSEWTKPRPNLGVIQWLAEQDEDRLFLSVITVAELRRGVERLPASARRNHLGWWIDEELRDRFEGRVLVVDEAIGNSWGRLIAGSETRGKRMNLLDGFLAATALMRGFTLVTRNTPDFEDAGCAVHNPWSEKG